MDGGRSSSSDSWVRTGGTKRPVEDSEQIRSASEETRSYVQEENTVEDVEARILYAAAVDVEWRFRCGPERTKKYFQLISVQVKNEEEEYTLDVSRKCFLQREEGKANTPTPP